MEHVRAHIRLTTSEAANEFVSILNSDATTDKYILEDFNSEHRVSARSLIGVIYMTADHNDDTFLVNMSNDGVFPSGIDKFRV